MCAAYKRIAPNTSLEHWHTQWCRWCWRTCAWQRERVRCVRSRLLLHHLPNARTIHAHNKPPAPKRRRRRDLIQSAYTSADGLIFFVFSCKTKKQSCSNEMDRNIVALSRGNRQPGSTSAFYDMVLGENFLNFHGPFFISIESRASALNAALI